MKRFFIAVFLATFSFYGWCGETLEFYAGSIAPSVFIDGKSYPILMYYISLRPSSPLVKEIRLVNANKGYMTLMDDEHPQRETTFNFTLNDVIYAYIYADQVKFLAKSNYTNSIYPEMIKQKYRVTSLKDNVLILTLEK